MPPQLAMLAPVSALHSITVGLTPASVALLIRHFYEKIRIHRRLDQAFNAFAGDWNARRRLLTPFWSAVAPRAKPYGDHRERRRGG